MTRRLQFSGSFVHGGRRSPAVPHAACVFLLALCALIAGASDAAAAGGARQWVARYDGPAHQFDQAAAVAISPTSGAVFVTGDISNSSDVATVAYDGASGAKLWVRRFTGPGDSFDAGRAIAVSADGSEVFVTGRTEKTNLHGRFLTLAYDAATGASLWRAFVTDGKRGVADSGGVSVAVSPDSATVFVTGTNFGRTSAFNYTTIAYDAVTGDREWIQTYNNGSNDRPTDLVLSPDGGTVFVTGESDATSPFGRDFFTIAYDAGSGAPLWSARYDTPADNFGEAIAVNPTGSLVFVTGDTASNGSFNYATVAYSATTGQQQWVSTYDPPGKRTDGPSDIAAAPDGASVYVTGTSAGKTTGDDYATVAYDPTTGSQQWATRYDGPGHADDHASAIAAGSGGAQVYVTGWSAGVGGDLDYATIAYRTSNGAQLWASRRDGSASSDDYATAIAVGPDPVQVVVTGENINTGSDGDYATVSYDTGVGLRPLGGAGRR